MTVWNDLIEQLQRLDDFAKKIQSRPDILPGQNVTEDEIEVFRSKYQEWYTDCLSILEGEQKNRFVTEYDVRIKSFIFQPSTTINSIDRSGRYRYTTQIFKYPYAAFFQQAIFTQKTILLQASKLPSVPTLNTQAEAIEIIKNMARNFHLFVHYSNIRHGEQEPWIIIGNEYDVQDIFHGLLRLFFKDIRKEEGAPSHAGKNSRIDFFLAQEQIIVETKKTRENLREKGVGEELTIDIIYYREHRGYNTFIGFVYDPDKYIKNPDGLTSGLQQTDKDMNIIIIINQG